MFSPATQEWFDGAFPAPTAAQVGAWRAIAAGEHTLWEIESVQRISPRREAGGVLGSVPIPRHEQGESMGVTRMQVTPMRPKVASTLRDAGPADVFADELTVSGVRYTGGASGAGGGDVIAVIASEFSGARIVGELSRTTFDNCVFDSSDLSNLRADETSFLESAIVGSRLTGLSLTDGVLRDVAVDDTRADLVSFRGSKFQKVVFTGCNLAGADFQRVRFRSARFEGCDLTGAQFSQASIEHNTTFVDCRLVDVRGVRELKGAQVRGDDLLGLAGSLAREVGIHVDW